MSWLDIIRTLLMGIWSTIPQEFKDRVMQALWAAMEAAVKDYYRAWKAQAANEGASNEKP